jgi:hypothetical protein
VPQREHVKEIVPYLDFDYWKKSLQNSLAAWWKPFKDNTRCRRENFLFKLRKTGKTQFALALAFSQDEEDFLGIESQVAQSSPVELSFPLKEVPPGWTQADSHD